MEGGGKKGSSLASSGSSFSADLFGSKSTGNSPPSTSSSIFDSVFSNSNKNMGTLRKQEIFENQGWKPQAQPNGNGSQSSKAGENQDPAAMGRRSIFQDEKNVNPWSSVYYGGQDNYSSPSSAKKSGSLQFFKKDDDKDEGASRGEWWQGSLYY